MKGNVPLRSRGGFTAVVLTLPCLLLLAVFTYRPVVRSIELSLYDSDLFGRPTRFVGLEHYGALLADPGLRTTLAATFAITILSTLLAIGGALAAALPLRRASARARGIVGVVLSLPFAYSAAAASAVFAGLFAPAVGTLNTLLAGIGVAGPPWLQSPGWAVLAIALATAWYEFGFAFLVLLAALSQTDESVLEAAALDGAGEWRTTFWIIVPMLAPSLLFLLVTQTISGLQTFTQVHVLTRGGPSGATSTLVHQLYERAFGLGVPDYGSASAIALTLLVLVLLVTAAQFGLTRRRVA